MINETRWLPSAVVLGALLCASVPASSAPLDFIFGKKAADTAAGPLDPKQRVWRLGEFTYVQLVPREKDAADNQHPAQWAPESLRQQLALVRTELRKDGQALFDDEELGALVLPLSQALSLAGPGDDVLLLSTHRRGSGIFVAPFGITARLFVQDGALQLIVHDARLDFVDAAIGTRVTPSFTFGSRAKAGVAALQSASAVSRRADWLSIPAGLPAGPAPAPTIPATASALPPPAMAPAAPQSVAGPGVTVKPNPSPAVVVTPAQGVRPREPASADEIEQRLVTLKRLLDRQLISPEEYQRMRKDVLQLL